MAAYIPRLMYPSNNKVLSAATVLTASSTEATHPLQWLLDQQRSKPWRSGGPFVIYLNFNDTIDFERSGTKTATIAAGTYATGAALAAAVVTALEAADATPVWTCTYSVSTFKFTIGSDLVFTLYVGTGANLHKTAFKPLGWIASGGTGVDATSSSITAPNAVYQSNHFIGIDIVNASTLTACVVLNSTSTATIKVGRSTASVVSAATNGALDILAGDANLRIVYQQGANSRRYYAIIIEDMQNTNGFVEVGYVFLGTYVQPTYAFTEDNPRSSNELSTTRFGASGANFHVLRAQGGMWTFVWEADNTDLAALQALRSAVPAGKNWLFNFDAANPTTHTVYGFITNESPMSEDPINPSLTNVTFGFQESLA